MTAAYELLTRTQIKPVVYEVSSDVGGISRTVEYKGNRIDIGGHRFFSKSERVVNWWLNILPLETKDVSCDKVMLVRNRISSIFFIGKFFDYPVTLDIATLSKLGIKRTLMIILSYLRVRVFPLKDETYLDAFFINRFGRELYKTFFKSYTEKVWGVPCHEIRAEWGAQRVKGLSIMSAIRHFIRSQFIKERSLTQHSTETSLIDRFMYPKLGPGQMWQEAAAIIKEKGGQVHLGSQVVSIVHDEGRVTGVRIRDLVSGLITEEKADYVISSMPISELMEGFQDAPADLLRIARGLRYREFIVVGLLVDRLAIRPDGRGVMLDNWIYIQDERVRLGRVQIFNNWSPYMVDDPEKVWLGLEYFCNEADDLWSMSDDDIRRMAVDEMAEIGFIDIKDVLDAVVIRQPKAYPAYFGSYDSLDRVRTYLNGFGNLFLVGRNGMHRYNNQDHSMLTAMIVVDNIVNNIQTKDNIWSVNIEREYLESRKE